MNTRILSYWGLCFLVALFATGCETLRGFRPAPPIQYVPVNSPSIPNNQPSGAGYAPPETIGGGTIVGAGGIVPSSPPGTPRIQPIQPVEGVPSTPPAPMPVPQVPQLPQPRPLPTTNGQPPARPPVYSGQPSQFADPHLRGMPTVSGKAWELAPWETPADRLAELTAHLEGLLAQNKALLARAKELEALGATREQALVEAMREIDSVNATAAKEKAAYLAQITALQGRIQRIEEEDIEFLEAVIEALGKLLPPEKKP